MFGRGIIRRATATVEYTPGAAPAARTQVIAGRRRNLTSRELKELEKQTRVLEAWLARRG